MQATVANMRKILLTVSLFMFSQVASAADWQCFKPMFPSCLTAEWTYTDEWRRDQCLRRLQAFRWEVDFYLQCLAEYATDTISEVKQESEDTLAEYDRTVEYWDCMLLSTERCKTP